MKKRVFADVIKLGIFEVRKISWVTRWALNIITCILTKGRQKIKQIHAEEKAKCEDRSSDHSNMVMSQGMPQLPEPKETRKDSALQLLEGDSPVNTLIWVPQY